MGNGQSSRGGLSKAVYNNPKVKDLRELFMEVFEMIDLNENAEVSPEELRDFLKICPTENGLHSHLEHLSADSKSGEPIKKEQFGNLFAGYVKKEGVPDDETYADVKSWLEEMRTRLQKEVEVRKDRMRAIKGAIFQHLNKEGKVMVPMLEEIYVSTKDDKARSALLDIAKESLEITQEQYTSLYEDRLKSGAPTKREMDLAKSQLRILTERAEEEKRRQSCMQNYCVIA
eukprot:CAMPEP_0170177240 /NCGR_PEP_ID=MMETSP0040_2-20121228/9925_1 /TAXON_ID=641309 /ORGANISM="Lotharella oceanica, Strain CCMP622" /LENGTH=229 /DNA_ID=CAMNT_0010419813 /DNA_START=42 /DNA_END=731 /DNA_ORIENTATION=-